MLGAEGVAYTPIVASGADACTIHYSRNDKVTSCTGHTACSSLPCHAVKQSFTGCLSQS
jgi:hypothetical protein